MCTCTCTICLIRQVDAWGGPRSIRAFIKGERGHRGLQGSNEVGMHGCLGQALACMRCGRILQSPNCMLTAK